jgi:hypothetical protein
VAHLVHHSLRHADRVDEEVNMNGITALVIVMVAAAFAGTMAMLAMWRAKHRHTTCPETGRDVEVAVDRKHAAKAVFTGEHLKVADCERWPERAGCDRGCEKHLHA